MRTAVVVAGVAAIAAVILLLFRPREPVMPNELPAEVLARVEDSRASRDILKAEDPVLFQTVSEILLKTDPMGINFETNTDEYEPEVGTILPRLKTCRSEQDARRVIHEEFVTWFGGADTAGPEANYAAAAREIWSVWNSRSSGKPRP